MMPGQLARFPFAPGAVVGLSVLLTGIVGPSPASANAYRMYLECPCELEREGSNFRITAGIRNFTTRDTGELHLGFAARTLTTRAFITVQTIAVEDSLAPGESLARATYEIPVDESAVPLSPRELEIGVYEKIGDRLGLTDKVRTEFPADLAADFRVGDRDYLKDTDGDGVGDINERTEGTDPADADSTPDDPVIDVLALYSQGFPALYNGDPATRIRHLFTAVNEMFANSGVHLRLRVVGMVEARVDETLFRSDTHREIQAREVERYGADLVAWFQPPLPNPDACGYARWTSGEADRPRGHFDPAREDGNYAMIFGNCTARALASQLGRVMGLGVSFSRQSVGQWRWSRGYAIEDDFGTIMTFGLDIGEGARLDVFSNPRRQCIGNRQVSKPCGVERTAEDGADAVASLNAASYRIAAVRDSHPDTDGDGFIDPFDDLPADPADWLDTDGDGIGNIRDTDDDGDGVADADDVFPLDGSESVDTDGDGVGDNADAFPMDPGETSDRDGDGVGDTADRFPDDPAEWIDTDADGVGDNGDVWPEDHTESTDTDGDGIGDNADPDADNDGVADGLDPYPLDAGRTDLGSYLFIGESPGDEAGRILSTSTGGGRPAFAIGVPQHDAGLEENAGAVYLVSAADLETLDAADGQPDRTIDLGRVASGAHSWKFVGEHAHDMAGSSIASGGDLNGDGQADLLVGAPFAAGIGAAYLVSGADFAAADEADGEADRTIGLQHAAAQPGSWKFVGENSFDGAGNDVAALPDSDADGIAELLIGASGHRLNDEPPPGGAYLLSSGDLAAADAADGSADGEIQLANASSQAASWKFVGEAARDRAGSRVASAGDFSNDGDTNIVIAAAYRQVPGERDPGAAYLISTGDFAASDAADGAADHVIDLVHVAGQPNSWKLSNGLYGGWSSLPVSTAAGSEGTTDWLLVGNHLISWRDLSAADAADESADGVVDLHRLVLQPGSWYFYATRRSAFVGDVDDDGTEEVLTAAGVAYLFSPAILAEVDALAGNREGEGRITSPELERSDGARKISGIPFNGISAAGDVDGDGRADILMGGAAPATDPDKRGAVYLVLADDLFTLDALDARTDFRAHLGNLVGDTDADGILNTVDADDDGDGFPDNADTFQLDPDEWMDSDGDGVGDNADELPDNSREWLDTDGDGLGNFYADDDDDGDGILDSVDRFPLDTDNDGMDNDIDADDDNDTVPDTEDHFPLDAAESLDTDGDGTGNNADTDDDGDGVADADDAVPLDARDSVDTDGDGVGDNTDAFPSDAAETADFDGDGIGDNADTDDDNDGVPDTEDDFPFDAQASKDTDGDGVPDSLDRYPTHPGEWENTDNSGFGDNRDTDDDNDGVPDTEDVYPKDRTRSDLSSYRLELGVKFESRPPSLASVGDLDGDGKPEFALGMYDNDEAFLISPTDLRDADRADGIHDGSLDLRNVLAQSGSWKLTGEDGYRTGQLIFPLGDIDGDAHGEFMVGGDAFAPAIYIVSGADLLGADAADGTVDSEIELARVASQASSWKLDGLPGGGRPYSAVSADLNGDGVVEFLVSQWDARGGASPGIVYVISADTLPVVDALDRAVDGVMELRQFAGHALWRLIGEGVLDLQSTEMAMTDFDGDGRTDLVVGALSHDATQLNEGAVYLMNVDDLSAADLADGTANGRVELARIADQPNSWKVIGGEANAALGRFIGAGDFDGDGSRGLAMVSSDPASSAAKRVINVLSGTSGNLAAVDAADGTSDGLITTGSVWPGENRKLAAPEIDDSFFALDVADFDGDGRDDFLLGGVSTRSKGRIAHLVASTSLFGAASEFAAGLPMEERVRQSGSYLIHAPEAAGTSAARVLTAAGDLDADGLDDLVLAVVPNAAVDRFETGAAYVIMAVDLPYLDSADGRMDGKVFLSNVVRMRHESGTRSSP